MLTSYKMVIMKFNPNDILKEKALDVMTAFKNEITSLVTESFFSNPEYRFNFYKTLVALFNNNLRKIFSGNLKKYINHIYFIFKGGNIIKAIIDLSEKNLKKEFDTGIYSPQNRSDSDFSIYCNYDECKKIFLSNSGNENFWEKESEIILLKIDNIAYNMLYQFRSLYDTKNESVKIGKENIKVTDFTNSNKIIVNSSIDGSDVNLMESTIEKIEVHYFELIKNTLNLNFDGKKITDNEEIHKIYFEHQNNFVKIIFDILSNKNINFLKNKNNEYIGKDFKYNVESYIINGHRFPIPYALLVDEHKIHGMYNMEEINENNSVSLEKLHNKSIDLFEKKLSSATPDTEINYCDENGNILLDNGNSFVNFSEAKSNFLGYNTQIINKKNINEILFNNTEKVTENFNNLIPIENMIFNKTDNVNNLFISSNRTLRFNSHLRATEFNLIRMKQNMILYFKLDNPININNKIIKFISIKIQESLLIFLYQKKKMSVLYIFLLI